MSTTTDEIKILVATDCHLGYKENDPVRCKDAIETFDEVLQLGADNGVDFILLGGDLFHKNKPSKETLQDCMKVLRKHCIGSTDSIAKGVYNLSVNAKDENAELNIKLPIYTIHGNHDDPTGQRHVSAVDVLSASGLVNYFGKYEFDNKLDIDPLVVAKGNTSIALYGVGYLRYDRMQKLFSENSINFIGSHEDKAKRFNMFILHQNRSDRGQPTSIYVHENMFPNFLDLVIWGHEHECKITPEKSSPIPISQPGSTIITALNKSEEGLKHVGLLTVNGKDFRMKAIPLQTVRPLYLSDYYLSSSNCQIDEVDKIIEVCVTQVENLITKSKSVTAKSPPLIRLRLHLDGGYQSFSNHKFGLRFKSRVANPEDILRFIKEKEPSNTDYTDESICQMSYSGKVSIESLVHEYFVNKAGKQKLQLSHLSDKGMTEAVESFVMKDDTKAIEYYLEQSLRQMQADANLRDTIMKQDEAVEEQSKMPLNQIKLTKTFSMPLPYRVVEKLGRKNLSVQPELLQLSPVRQYRPSVKTATRRFGDGIVDLTADTDSPGMKEGLPDIKPSLKVLSSITPPLTRKDMHADDDVVDLTGDFNIAEGTLVQPEIKSKMEETVVPKKYATEQLQRMHLLKRTLDASRSLSQGHIVQQQEITQQGLKHPETCHSASGLLQNISDKIRDIPQTSKGTKLRAVTQQYVTPRSIQDQFISRPTYGTTGAPQTAAFLTPFTIGSPLGYAIQRGQDTRAVQGTSAHATIEPHLDQSSTRYTSNPIGATNVLFHLQNVPQLQNITQSSAVRSVSTDTAQSLNNRPTGEQPEISISYEVPPVKRFKSE